MEVIYNSRFQKISWDSKNSLMLYEWTTETAYFTDEEYCYEHTVIGDVSEQYRIVNHLIDTFNFRFTIPPYLQEWVGQNLFPRLEKSGSKKMSFVVPPDVFAQISIQQTMEEDHKGAFAIRFFEDMGTARNWLLGH